MKYRLRYYLDGNPVNEVAGSRAVLLLHGVLRDHNATIRRIGSRGFTFEVRAYLEDGRRHHLAVTGTPPVAARLWRRTVDWLKRKIS